MTTENLHTHHLYDTNNLQEMNSTLRLSRFSKLFHYQMYTILKQIVFDIGDLQN